jgi:preprotein translocase subunit SecB
MTENKNIQPSFNILAQYVKDISFENPNAPKSFTLQGSPSREFNIGINAQKLGDDNFEVAIHLTVKITLEEKAVFLVDLVYAGLFAIVGIPDENMEQLLLVDCPIIIYPFARRIVSDLSRDGGYPALLLEPVDFRSLYINRKQQGATAAPLSTPENTTAGAHEGADTLFIGDKPAKNAANDALKKAKTASKKK